MDLIEGFLRAVVSDVLTNCKAELAMVGRDTSVLEQIVKPFPRLSYDEAVRIIKGEQDVNGQNSIKSLEDELKQVEAKMEEINKEIELEIYKLNMGLNKQNDRIINNFPFDENAKCGFNPTLNYYQPIRV